MAASPGAAGPEPRAARAVVALLGVTRSMGWVAVLCAALLLSGAAAAWLVAALARSAG